MALWRGPDGPFPPYGLDAHPPLSQQGIYQQNSSQGGEGQGTARMPGLMLCRPTEFIPQLAARVAALNSSFFSASPLAVLFPPTSNLISYAQPKAGKDLETWYCGPHLLLQGGAAMPGVAAAVIVGGGRGLCPFPRKDNGHVWCPCPWPLGCSMPLCGIQARESCCPTFPSPEAFF